jgi:DNA-binding PadR family transcriptional regulator
MMIEIARDRTLGVPRGLLRFLVLEMLSGKPMAGAEIAEEIEIQTKGRWKPSPGSIYPLMAWMLRKGFTVELPKNPDGFKRYSFTPAGHKYYQNQLRLSQNFVGKIEFLIPMLIGGLQLEPYQEKLSETREHARKLMQEFITLIHNPEILSAFDVTEMAEALKECSEKLGNIAQKVESAKHRMLKNR